MNEYSALDRAFAEEVDPSQKELLMRLMAASRRGSLCIQGGEAVLKDSPLIVQNQGRIYIQRNWALETAIVEHLSRHLKRVPSPPLDLEKISLSPQLSPSQVKAVHHALSSPFTIITGGPGTGKTFVARELIRSASPLRVKVAAPTGKAAERLDLQALTLHGLLGLRPGRTRLFDERKIAADLILIDEASMIDASLFAHLFRAIPEGARLVLIGDADQLPPVGGGSLFSEMATLFSTRLEGCHRTEDLKLYQLYEAARIGDARALLSILEPFPKELFDWIARELALSPALRVICPLRKGPFGVDAINAELMKRHPKGKPLPILITKNDAELKIYNGMTGVLNGSEVRLDDGREFQIHQLPGYEMAFALSVHKSQGSEFEEVLCLLPPGSEEFGREALYTALTRAKKKIRLVGEREVIEKMLTTRFLPESGFQERMKALLEKE
jgi:exodeoxyribonuclease V alpha subunit